MVDDEFIRITHRELPYPTFDADNHLYETQDALTKFLPPGYEGVVKYVELNGRTKLAIRDTISDYIPNPTFVKVAVPGGYGRDVTKRDRDTSADPTRTGTAQHRVMVMPGIEAFFDPEPRLELMKEMGIDRTLLWPTLASVLEERVADAPDVAVAVVHALNEWMHEHWSYVYSDAIYATPIISLADGNDTAIRELELVAERGAKIFLMRVAPVPTWKGRKSFALPEFDPFWQAVQELGLVVGMHSGDSGYARYTHEWDGVQQEFRAFGANGTAGFLALASEKSNLIDALASIIGHGLATRFPELAFMPVEFSTDWMRPFYAKLQRVSDQSSVLFDESPVDVFNRNVFTHIFHEADPKSLLDLGIPADHLMFGSDFPHPEGMADPLAYHDIVADLPLDDQKMIMGGTLAKALKVGEYAEA